VHFSKYLAGILLSWLIVLTGLQAAPDFPQLTDRVVDQAGLLSAPDEAALNAKLEQHEKETSNQIVVVTLKSLQGYDIADYGYQLGRHWGIGQKGKDNGALLIVAPNERKMRIEVGYGLEGFLTDAISSDIIRNKIRPAFRAGNYPAGINAGVDAMLAAVKGSYKPAPRKQSSGTLSDFIGVIFPVFFLLIFASGELIKGRKKQQLIQSLIPAAFTGGIAWIITGLIIVGLLVAALVFIMSLLGGGGRGGNSGRRSGTWGGGSWGGGGFGGGGFSGGGGGFGGGGASGGW